MSNPVRERSRPSRTELEVVNHWPQVAKKAFPVLLLIGGPLIWSLWFAEPRPIDDTPTVSQVAERPASERSTSEKPWFAGPIAPRVEPSDEPRLRRSVAEVLAEKERATRPRVERLPVAPTEVRTSPEPILVQRPTSETRPSVAPAPADHKAAARADERARVLHSLDEDELLYFLHRQVKELSLDTVTGTSDKLWKSAKEASGKTSQTDSKPRPPGIESLLTSIADRDDLRGLPFRKDSECRLDQEAAERMAKMSPDVRSYQTRRSSTRDSALSGYYEEQRRVRNLVRCLVDQKSWHDEGSIPALVQMLQTEEGSVREQLARTLSGIKGKRASIALAQRALYDLSPEVRFAALQALAKRPKQEYREVLVEGLRYPWPTVAEHAAEALVAVQDRDAAGKLVGLLDQPDPTAPFLNEEKKWVATELVRVNHFRNCLLCHAPSTSSSDRVRGVMPTPGKPIPEVYYAQKAGEGAIVRADVTFLRQDFSVMHPVEKAAPWPEMQRHDYFRRTRELTSEEVEAQLAKVLTSWADPLGWNEPAFYPQREAVLFALRALTGKDAGPRSEDWRRLLAEENTDAAPKETNPP